MDQIPSFRLIKSKMTHFTTVKAIFNFIHPYNNIYPDLKCITFFNVKAVPNLGKKLNLNISFGTEGTQGSQASPQKPIPLTCNSVIEASCSWYPISMGKSIHSLNQEHVSFSYGFSLSCHLPGLWRVSYFKIWTLAPMASGRGLKG